MKKLVAILTVMTMVLTTLVVPTVAFGTQGNKANININTSGMGDIYIQYLNSNETVPVDVDEVGAAVFQYDRDSNTWFYENNSVADIFLVIDGTEGERASWEIKCPSNDGPPVDYDVISSSVGIVGYQEYPESDFFIQAQFVGGGEDDHDPNDMPYTIEIGEMGEDGMASPYWENNFECTAGNDVKLSVDFSTLADIETVWFVNGNGDGQKIVVNEKIDEDGNIVPGVYSVTIEDISADFIDNITYVFRVKTTTGIKDYKFRPVSVGYQGEEVEIPNDKIVIRYNFYNEYGQFRFFPITVDLDEYLNAGQNTSDSEVAVQKTIGDLVNDNDDLVNGNDNAENLHFDGLTFSHWEAADQGPDTTDLTESIIVDTESGEYNIGGRTIDVNAIYVGTYDGIEKQQVVVDSEITYYDIKGKKQCYNEAVIIADPENETTESVVDALNLDETIVHFGDAENHSNLIKWDYRRSGLFEHGIDYDLRLSIKAIYEKQPVRITCIYRDTTGAVAELSGNIVVNKLETNVYEAFENFLQENSGKIPNFDGITGWAFNSNLAPSGGPGDELTAYEPYDELTVAAIYEASKPVYIYRAYLKYDSVSEEYYCVNGNGGIWLGDEVFYIESSYPDMIVDTNDLFSQEVYSVTNEAFANEYSVGLNLQGYKMDNVTFSNEVVNDTTAYIYRYAPRYDMLAVYENAYVEVVLPNGEIVGYYKNPNEKFTIDRGRAGDVWEKETIASGGAAIPNGSVVPIDPIYTKFSLWTVKQDPLKAENIKNALEEKTLGEVKCEADELKTEYYDVKLLKSAAEGQDGVTKVAVPEDEFPDGGVWIMFEYPEGMDKRKGVVITHMLKENEPDKIEIITEDTLGEDGKPRIIKTDRGVKVKMYSLSPISVAYGDDELINGANQPGTTPSTPGASGSATPDSSVNTGDNFNAIPYIAIMAIALAGVAAALFRRKTVK